MSTIAGRVNIHMAPIWRVMWFSLVIIACGGGVPQSAHGQSFKEQVVGTWKLISWTRIVDGVEMSGGFGPAPIGQYIYAPDGHFCASLMAANRANLSGHGLLGGSSEEKASALGSYIGYCGRYEVEESDRSILHRVEISSYPNWTGTSQKLFVAIAGNRMKVTLPVPSPDGETVNVFLWERAE